MKGLDNLYDGGDGEHQRVIYKPYY